MNADWYIYYKVRTEHGAQLQERVGAMQRRLRAQSGVTCSLKRRPSAKDGRDTWMEVYLAPPQDFEHTLARELQSEHVQELIDGERRVEHFLDVISCA